MAFSLHAFAGAVPPAVVNGPSASDTVNPALWVMGFGDEVAIRSA